MNLFRRCPPFRIKAPLFIIATHHELLPTEGSQGDWIGTSRTIIGLVFTSILHLISTWPIARALKCYRNIDQTREDETVRPRPRLKGIWWGRRQFCTALRVVNFIVLNSSGRGHNSLRSTHIWPLGLAVKYVLHPTKRGFILHYGWISSEERAVLNKCWWIPSKVPRWMRFRLPEGHHRDLGTTRYCSWFFRQEHNFGDIKIPRYNRAQTILTYLINKASKPHLL